MTREQIVQAINGDNYQALLVIYNKYKINNKFDQFFAQQLNPEKEYMHFKMLHSKVKDILRKLDQNNGFQKVSNKSGEPEISVRPLDFKKDKIKMRPVVDSNPHINRSELTEALQQLYDDNGRMNQEMKSKHAAMRVEKKADKRKILVNELSVLENKINHNWVVIDEWYKEFKTSKEKTNPKELTPVETANKIEAAKRYIDRYCTSTKPATITEVNERTKYLKTLGIDYIARPLRDNKKQTKSSKKK